MMKLQIMYNSNICFSDLVDVGLNVDWTNVIQDLSRERRS